MSRKTNFKKMISRINRGIVLGIILAIILVSFVVIDATKFQIETKQIRTDLIACITEIAELNNFMEYERIGKAIIGEDQEEIKAGMEAIIEKYYADPAIAERITVYDEYDSIETMDALSEWFDRTASMDVLDIRIFDTSDEFKIRFERQGYRFAYVQINDLPMEMDLLTASRSPEPFLGAGPSYLIDPKYPEDEIAYRYAKNRTLKFYLSGSVYLTNVDGEWKILMSDFYTKANPEVE